MCAAIFCETVGHCSQHSKCAAVLQEVERILFLASSVSHLKGQWQMASQGGMQGSGLGAFGGPLAMRQASCAFLEFAALAVGHQQQHACCPPVSPQEKVCWISAHSSMSQATMQDL